MLRINIDEPKTIKLHRGKTEYIIKYNDEFKIVDLKTQKLNVEQFVTTNLYEIILNEENADKLIYLLKRCAMYCLLNDKLKNEINEKIIELETLRC